LVSRGVSFGVRSQWTTSRFTQVGLQPDQRAPIRVMSANIGWSPPGYGSLGLTYIRQDNRDLPGSELAAASYTIGVGTGALTLAAFKPLNGAGAAAVSVTFTMALGERTSAFAMHTAQANANETLVQVQQALPPG